MSDFCMVMIPETRPLNNFLYNDSCLLVDIKKFIKDVFMSYSNKEDIIRQFLLDFPRMKILLNYVHQIDEVLMIRKVLRHVYSNHVQTSFGKMNIVLFLQMMSTQSSFFFHFKTLYDVYSGHDRDMHVTDDGTPAITNIIFKEEYINITFNKKFKHLNIINNTIYGIIKSNMMIVLQYDRRYKCYFIKDTQGIFEWEYITQRET